MKSKIIYLVRHGQSQGNVSPVFQSVESPLSELGLKQADDVAERVSHLRFDKFVSSPIKRTKQTAEAISKRINKKPEYSELFVERIKPSSIDGKPYEDIQANKVWRDWENSLITQGNKIEDGENFDEITKRAKKALEYLKSCDESSILVVTHGYFLRLLVATVLLGENLSPESLSRFIQRTAVENTAITVIKYSNDFEQGYMWRLWTHNDHAHFAE